VCSRLDGDNNPKRPNWTFFCNYFFQRVFLLGDEQRRAGWSERKLCDLTQFTASYDTLCAGPGAEAAEHTAIALLLLPFYPHGQTRLPADAAHWGISQHNQVLEKPKASVGRSAGQENIRSIPSNQSLWYKNC